MSNRAKPANLPKNPLQMPLEYPLYMLVACFICLMINTYHFYLNSAFNCKRNKDIFRVCYMTSRAIDLVLESARVEKRTVVESLAKFIVLAREISRIIVEAVKVLENIVLCYSESSRELSWNVAKFATNIFVNFRAKVRENKERNSCISFALLFHNTVRNFFYLSWHGALETWHFALVANPQKYLLPTCFYIW